MFRHRVSAPSAVRCFVSVAGPAPGNTSIDRNPVEWHAFPPLAGGRQGLHVRHACTHTRAHARMRTCISTLPGRSHTAPKCIGRRFPMQRLVTMWHGPIRYGVREGRDSQRVARAGASRLFERRRHQQLQRRFLSARAGRCVRLGKIADQQVAGPTRETASQHGTRPRHLSAPCEP